MRKVLLAGAAALIVAGSTTAFAQQHGWLDHGRPWFSAQDRSAFADARIAAVHAGLKLSADQEKLWPPVEAAVKDLVKLRIDRAEARMKARDGDQASVESDPVTRLRDRADAMAATAAALKKVAEAADPLYKSLDDGQKRRLRVLTRFDRMRGDHPDEGFRHRHRWDHDHDGGPRWDRSRSPDSDGPGGMMDDREGPRRL
jgi:hypothetical protein